MSKYFNKRNGAIVLFTVVTILILYFILPVSVPLIMALISALLVEPLVKFFQKRLKINRKLSVGAVFILFIASLSFILYFSITRLVGQAIQFVENLPEYINEVTEWWAGFEADLTIAFAQVPEQVLEQMSLEMENFLVDFRTSITGFINAETLTGVVTNIPEYLVSFIVYLIALFLIMIDLPKIRTGIYSYFHERTAEKVRFMTARLSKVVWGFAKAQFLVSLLILAGALIGLYLIAPEVALIMAIVIWIIDLIPIIGSIAVLGPWAIFQLISGDIEQGIQLSILAIVLLLIRRIIEPKVMGSHIGLSPLATLIAMFIGLKLFGLLGFIIGPLILIVFNSSKEAGIIKMNFKF
ncbi:sporulation integral membrane protein YtvI [Jeotgalibacillus proteolyticus]|uniref:Sporulation integral membrane protein YtvI n=1 Tax=Jeotgalibacillus proteolyticus TaxID=2082395 RepID=A0A2S5GGS8_9BACL|nr:sporulation integral membrane protein YtvI [Jeotgalibacillus proteolyticus]PPA72168.1 sporulation integral membrane protein YtvI [Jeotgalibacillus proteolyticus]